MKFFLCLLFAQALRANRSSPLRGFVAVCKGTSSRAVALLAKEHEARIVPYYVVCSNPALTNHIQVVHDTHVAMLQACARHKWSPCVIMEADSTWVGRLMPAVESALAELSFRRKEWDVLTMGINAPDVHDAIQHGALRLTSLGRETVTMTHTVGGCHAYVAADPARLAGWMARRDVLSVYTQLDIKQDRLVARRTYTPCIEWASDLRVELARDIAVLQHGKAIAEGMPWHVDAAGAFHTLVCDQRYLKLSWYALLKTAIWNKKEVPLCVYT